MSGEECLSSTPYSIGKEGCIPLTLRKSKNRATRGDGHGEEMVGLFSTGRGDMSVTKSTGFGARRTEFRPVICKMNHQFPLPDYNFLAPEMRLMNLIGSTKIPRTEANVYFQLAFWVMGMTSGARSSM